MPNSLQHDLEEQKKRHQAESEEKHARLQILVKEKDQVLVEKEELQNITEGFRDESESILQDFDTIAQQLKVADSQHQKGMKEHARMLEKTHLSKQSRREQRMVREGGRESRWVGRREERQGYLGSKGARE